MKTWIIACFMLCGAVVGLAQVSVEGLVTDAQDGQTLIGVSVAIKGTQQGTVTDLDGRFTLESVSEDATLVFSYIGYTDQEVVVGAQTHIEIQLAADVQALEEVVVVGYGTTAVKELSGAVSVVKGEDIIARNPVRMDQALQGQAAGVQISTVSGSPGGASNIRIRGLTSNGDNDPLVIVDGIIYATDGLNALNPADIESINVLKDASAAIYGVRAANGVIIITTKQGSKGTRPSVDFNAYWGMQQTTKRLDMLNARQYAILKNEMFGSGGQTLPFNNPQVGGGTHWQDSLFQLAPMSNYNLNLNGGGEKSQYSIGASSLSQKGIIGGDKARFERFNLRANFTMEVSPKIKFKHVSLFTREKRKTLPEGGLGSVLANAVNASPVASINNSVDDSYTLLEEFSDIINPMAQIENTYNENGVYKLVGKEEINYEPNKHLKLTGRVGYSYARVSGKTFNPLVYYGLGKPQNSAKNELLETDSVVVFGDLKALGTNGVSQSETTYLESNIEFFANYDRVFDQKHHVQGVLGYSRFENISSSLSGFANDIPYNLYTYASIQAADNANPRNNTGAWEGINRLQSWFVRGEYSYDHKYIASVIVRRDASTRFGKENRFGYFPSISVAWVASAEPFFNVPFIQFAKLRASFGVSGNDKIKDFRYRALLGGEGVYPFSDVLKTGVAIRTPANESLKWETTAQTNIGLEATTLDGKMDLTLNYFIKQTGDLLFVPPVSALLGTYGAGTYPPTVNGGDVKNTGFEMAVTYTDNITDDLSYNVGVNFMTLKNKVTRLPEGVEFLDEGSFGVGGEQATRMAVGNPLGSYFGYQTDGVYQTAEEVASRGVTQSGAVPGDFRYVDQNGDGVINDADRTFLGSPIPKATIGLSLGANYKGIDFSVALYASMGNKLLRNYERDQPLANMMDYWVNRWTGPGSTNEYPRITTSANKNRRLSDFYVEDASFLRMQNVQLGYTIKNPVFEKMGIKKFRFYVAVNNLFTLTRYKGFNPDYNSGSALSGGVDGGAYPQARVIMSGLSINF